MLRILFSLLVLAALASELEASAPSTSSPAPIRLGASSSSVEPGVWQRGRSKKGGGSKKKKKAPKPKKKPAKAPKPKLQPMPRPIPPEVPRPPLYPQEEGIPGQVFPDVRDVRIPPTPLHGNHGLGAPHTVVDVARRPTGGIAVLWSDQGTGAIAWYLTEIDAEGRVEATRGPIDMSGEMPASEADDGEDEEGKKNKNGKPKKEKKKRDQEADDDANAGPPILEGTRALLGFDAEGEPRIGWITERQIRLRTPSGKLIGLGKSSEKGAKDKAGADEGAADDKAAPATVGEAALSYFPDGSGVAAWQSGNALRIQRLADTGRPDGDLDAVLVGDAAVTLRVVPAPEHTGVVLWSVDGEVRWALSRPVGRRKVGDAGPGELLAAVPARDASGHFSGVWLAVAADGELALRHLSVGQPIPRGGRRAAEGDEPTESDLLRPDVPFRRAKKTLAASVQLALGAQGPMLYYEPEDVAVSSELWLFDHDGQPLRKKPRVFRARPQAARLLVSGIDPWLVFAERDRVVARQLDAEEGRFVDQGLRLDPDRADAHQHALRIASAGGHAPRAAAIWVDEGGGLARATLRLVSPEAFADAAADALAAHESGDPARERSDPVVLPAPHAQDSERRAPDPASHPEVSIEEGGTTLAVWNAHTAEGLVLRAQLFGLDQKPLGPAFDVDPEQTLEADERACVVSLRTSRGWAVAWVRAGRELWARHLGTRGLVGHPSLIVRVSPDGRDTVSEPALAVLDDNRVVVVWRANLDAGRLHGRFLGADLRIEGLPFRIDPGPGGDDASPSVAPGSARGFVLAWETKSGPKNDPNSDVFVRFFTDQGEPQSAPLAVSTSVGRQDMPQIVRLADHSWAVVWRDDLSGTDRACLRRIRPDRSRMGPPLVLGGSAPEIDGGAIGEAEIDDIGSASEPAHTASLGAASSPGVAACDDGLIAAWVSAERGLGYDVSGCYLGPRFDGGVERVPTPVEGMAASPDQ